MIVGYARVSTKGQSLAPQRRELLRAGVDKVVEEKAGGTKARPRLESILDNLSAGDALVVARLDRLGRSLPHLVSVVEGLSARGVAFKSLHEDIDTSSAAGRLQLAMFAAFAQFERDLISERTKAGLAAARAAGRPPGRPPALTAAKLEAAESMRTSGSSYQQIAEALGVSKTTIYRHFRTNQSSP